MIVSVAESLGFEVAEFNASDKRNKAAVQDGEFLLDSVSALRIWLE